MKEISGEKNDNYDYSDLTKYGPDKTIDQTSGITKYVLTVNKALVLQITEITPNTSSVEFDSITCTTSDSSQLKASGSIGGGIFAFSANKDEAGNPSLGKPL